jgi:hypothetical protein
MKLDIRGSWLATFEDDEPAGFSTEADRIELEKRQEQQLVGSSKSRLAARTEKARAAKVRPQVSTR